MEEIEIIEEQSKSLIIDNIRKKRKEQESKNLVE